MKSCPLCQPALFDGASDDAPEVKYCAKHQPRKRARTHKCPVDGCDKVVSNSMLMCPAHWHRVPKAIGAAVYREYRKQPLSEAHVRAMQLAIDSVNGSRGC